MSRPLRPIAEAKRLHNETGTPVMVGAALDDGEGGVFIQVAYGGLSVEDAEFVAATILRDLRQQIEREDHPCAACDARKRRVLGALAALESDGHRPTGRTRGETH